MLREIDLHLERESGVCVCVCAWVWAVCVWHMGGVTLRREYGFISLYLDNAYWLFPRAGVTLYTGSFWAS